LSKPWLEEMREIHNKTITSLNHKRLQAILEEDNIMAKKIEDIIRIKELIENTLNSEKVIIQFNRNFHICNWNYDCNENCFYCRNEEKKRQAKLYKKGNSYEFRTYRARCLIELGIASLVSKEEKEEEYYIPEEIYEVNLWEKV